ncbi:MAG: DinB family protein [Gemmatimonadota bacterium]
MIDPLITELNAEAATTRRVLDSVPAGQLTWKPHAKSFSLGQLALHVAQIPGQLAQLLDPDTVQVFPFVQSEATTTAELGATLDQSVAAATEMLSRITPERATANWSLMDGERQLLGAPRIGLVRALMFNHWYHHRGQLLVYLRLLDVHVPSVYGPTADENPFAG